ncbi:hypothetical protein ACFYT3_31530 [Nocardia amikacinitolerans]|uniref:hypothetical protein n=1 Tax=Nocardia amikacinitolerans TaxID=756689 RepID=UPI0036AF7353
MLAPSRVVVPDELKAQFDQLDRRKIDMSDQIMVVTDENMSLGGSTRARDRIAKRTGQL